MPRFCANLTWLFTELPFLERFAAAKAAGFSAVEILFPYDHIANEIIAQLREYDLTLALINGPPPNYTGGTPGFPAIPGGEERFRRDFLRSVRVARVLGAEKLHIMAGNAAGPEARRTYVENLRWAAKAAEGLMLTIEPSNPEDMPGYFLQDFDTAVEILSEIHAINLRLQFDLHHAQRITGDALAVWQKYHDWVVHVQIAGHPDRSEPNSETFDWDAFYAAMAQSHYGGWVSAEYQPAKTTRDGLGWMKRPRN